MSLTNKNLFFFVFIISLQSLKAEKLKQYFIKISPNQEVVNCGILNVLKTKTNIDFFKKDKQIDLYHSQEALQWINDSISKDFSANSKVLFFIHGFWGSLPYATHRTSKVFVDNYFHQDSSNVKAIVHIIWDAGSIYYKNSIDSLQASTSTLSMILNLIDDNIIFRKSLMCHSMGNRYLFQTLIKEHPTVHFEELIMMAPDLDYRKYEENFRLFSSIANKVNVFFHRKDQTLKMSSGINKIERLGRVNKNNISKDIHFIDCTDIKDIKSLSDSVMKHLYFLTSKTVKKQIVDLLN